MGGCRRGLHQIYQERDVRHASHTEVLWNYTVQVMFFLNQVNANNSFHKNTEYSRTSNLKCLKGSDNIGKVFDDNNVLSGITGYDKEMYLCQKVLANEGGGFHLFNLQFEDDNGGTVYELHYAPVQLGYEAQPIHTLDRSGLGTFTRQHIVMEKHYECFDGSNEYPWTVLCRSWKVRDSKGRFALLKESDKQKYGWVDKWEKQKHNKSTT